MIRRFRAAADIYEQMRLALDGLLGLPNPDTLTLTSMPPASESLRDRVGMVYAIISSDYCEAESVALLLAPLLQSGFVEELTKEQFAAIHPPPPRIRRNRGK